MNLRENPSNTQRILRKERRNLRAIVDSLEDEKCVLILGNHAFSKLDQDSQTQQDLTVPELIRQEWEECMDSSQEENPFDFFTQTHSLLDDAGGARERYFMDLANIKPDELSPEGKEKFQKISEIPFDLILSTYPFDLLRDVFDENKIAHDFGYYSFSEDLGEPEEPSRQKPLIYHLFGSVENKSTMIIDVDKLYNFFFAALGTNELPKLIQDKVSQASHLIFLGFDYDPWYMKILMRLLNLHEQNKYPYSLPPRFPKLTGLGEKDSWLFQEYFNLSFFNKKVETFIDDIHSECSERGIIRKNTLGRKPNWFEDIREMIDHDQLLESIDFLDKKLLDIGTNKSLIKRTYEFRTDFEEIKGLQTYDLYTTEEWNQKYKKFEQDFLKFLNEVELEILIKS